MFCPKCGKELNDTAKYCSGCGEKIIANASPEESGVLESAVLDAPTEPIDPIDPINPIEPMEPAASAESTGIPTGNVMTGTLPTQGTIPTMPTMTAMSAGASAAENAQSTAAAVLPQQNGVQGRAVKPTKSLKKKLIMGGAAAAGVAVVIVGVAGFTFAKADFAHAFMGNKKYSTALMGEQIERVLETPALSAGMASVSASSDADNVTGSLTSAFSQLKKVIPENGAQLEISVDAELSDEVLKELASEIDCDTEQVKKIVEAAKALKLSGGVQFSETGIVAAAAASEGGSELMKVNVLYDAETEAYYVSVPGVSDECLKFADEEAVIDMEALSKSDEADSVKKMLTDVLSKYKDCLSDAEITYGSAEFSIGDVEFKGKMSSAVFEDEKLADMISDVSEEFLDSDFADSLGDVSKIQKMVNSMVRGIEDCDSAKLTIENFVTSNNTVAGMRMELEGKKDGDKSKSEFAYLDTKGGIAFSVEADGEKVLELYETKENKSTGKYTVKLNAGGDSGKITIDYENKSEKKMLGQNVTLGDFTMKFSGDAFATEDMPFDKLTVKIADEDGALGYSIGAEQDNNSASLKLVLSEGIPEQIDAETMKISAAYDAMGEADKAKVNEYYTKLLEYMAAQTKESEFCNTVPVYDSTLADYIQATAKRALRERELSQNYAAYDETTGFAANQAAHMIYSSARYIGFNPASTGAVKVKLYYDNDGRLSILDSAGMSALENEILQDLGNLGYKNAYVELVIWPGRGPLCGVNVVMTDNSSNIPDGLPDAYSFLDREFKWGTEEDVGFVGSFAVGAYPRLANGEGGNTKTADEKVAAAVKTYSADAEKAAGAMSQYTGLTFTEGKTSYIDFSISNGTWRYHTSGGARINGSSADVSAYLTENVGAVEAMNVCFYFEGSKLVGTVASGGYYYSYFAVDDFKRGSTEKWSYMDGVISGNVVGTYPNLTKMTSLPQEYLDAMTGTWVNGSNAVTITADDLKNISFSFNRSGASITNVYVQTANRDIGNFYFYPNNSEPYISDGWYKYTKQ